MRIVSLLKMDRGLTGVQHVLTAGLSAVLLMLTVPASAAERGKGPASPMRILVFPPQGVTEQPGLSAKLGRMINEEFGRVEGAETIHPADVVTHRERDVSFRARADGVKDSIASARERWMVMDFKGTKTILEDVEKRLHEICGELIYPQLTREAAMLNGLALIWHGDPSGAVAKFRMAIEAEPAAIVKPGDLQPTAEKLYREAERNAVSRSERTMDTERIRSCVAGAGATHIAVPQLFYQEKELTIGIWFYRYKETKYFFLKDVVFESAPGKHREVIARAVENLFALKEKRPETGDSLAAAPAPKPTAGPQATTTSEERPGTSVKTARIVGWSALGVSVVSAGLAVLFGVQAKNTESDLEKAAGRDSRAPITLTDYRDMKDKGDTQALLSNAFWGVCGGAAVASAVSFFVFGDAIRFSSSSTAPKQSAFVLAPLSGRGWLAGVTREF